MSVIALSMEDRSHPSAAVRGRLRPLSSRRLILLDTYLAVVSAYLPGIRHDRMRSTRSTRYEVVRLTSPSVTAHGYQSGHRKLKIGTNSTESLARMEFLWERIYATGHYLCSRTSWRNSEPVIRTAPRTLLESENFSHERQCKAREKAV
jgi:hypothetical protein